MSYQKICSINRDELDTVKIYKQTHLSPIYISSNILLFKIHNKKG